MKHKIGEINFTVKAGKSALGVNVTFTSLAGRVIAETMFIDGVPMAVLRRHDIAAGMLGVTFPPFLSVGYPNKNECLIYDLDGDLVVFGTGGGASLNGGNALLISLQNRTYRIQVLKS